MGILINRESRIIVQGITGFQGRFHTHQMMDYGSQIVAGVTPGKGGKWVMDGKVPVFESVKIAVAATGADVSVIFVPSHFAQDAIFEAIDADVKLIVCVTEGVPVHDMIQVRQYLWQKDIVLVGPNSPGILTPGEAIAGVIPANTASVGNVGIVSRSGTLIYEVMYAIKRDGIGVSTCVGIGSDPVKCTGFIEVLKHFESDPHTEKIVLIGEIGGIEEEEAADYISQMTKPVIGYIAGVTAPPGRRMGHLGAIIEGGVGTAEGKIKALKRSGVQIAGHPEEIPQILKR
ncbi:MAG: succinate--CoA ligase subunit alpha [Anaerolineaceae bacterium]|nr:succinate--CoA ligase subunit alpha [Anaerolineaceae bacterium]